MINFEIKNNDSLAICGRESQSRHSLLPICEADTPLFLSAMDNKKSISEKITSKCSQSGRSMIEMLGVLAIIGVLSVGGIAGYSKAMMRYRINKTIEQITLIAGNVRAFWGPQRNYVGVECGGCSSVGCYGDSDGCPIHKKAKIFPDEMITITNGSHLSITNLFGNVIWLKTANKSKDGDNQAFGIAYNDIPQEACIELATHDWSTAGAGVVNINDSYNSKTPMDLEIATEYCNGNDIELWLYFDVDANSDYWNGLMGEY